MENILKVREETKEKYTYLWWDEHVKKKDLVVKMNERWQDLKIFQN